MNTPFEDLEFLSDNLPDEGESVVVTRRGGELVCQPIHGESFRDGIADAELYGRLVLANERLSRLSTVPLWSCLCAAFVLCAAFFQFTDLGWSAWHVPPAIAALAGLTYQAWVGARRRNYFQREVRGMLETQFRLRGINRFAVVGAIRQHPELGMLLDELSRHRVET
jgi:hypothetical protein